MRVVIERIAFCEAKSAGAKRRQRDDNEAYIPTTVGIPDTLPGNAAYFNKLKRILVESKFWLRQGNAAKAILCVCRGELDAE